MSFRACLHDQKKAIFDASGKFTICPKIGVWVANSKFFRSDPYFYRAVFHFEGNDKILKISQNRGI